MIGKTVLVVDGGGRGAALANKYLQSAYVDRVIAVPGNDLMLTNKNVKIFPQYKTTDVSQIIAICRSEKVDLVDVAQDNAVAVGLVDALLKSGIKVFGPTKLAGQIEWDKAWARRFMQRFKIPQPLFKVCRSEKEGVEFINSHKGSSWYVKASGLAGGKGAIFANGKRQALAAISRMKNFGNAGKTFLVEQCLSGEEFSAFAIVNEKKFSIVGYARDHKKAFDGDKGSNTGGMGCSSPPLAITQEVEKQIKNIFQKTVLRLSKTGRPYLGILYLGGMIDKNGKVYVIEFNARWGDPEAQVILPAIKDDLYQLVTGALNGKIPRIKKDKLYRIVVTAASKGYPDDYSAIVGKKINGLKNLVDQNKIKVFGAGVKKQNGQYVASGGRLFYVTGVGGNVVKAREMAYNALSKVSIAKMGLHFRKDIGFRDLERLNHRQPGQ